MTALTILPTRLVGTDDLCADDYREIYDELRSKMPLRRFVTFIGSAVSSAWWSLYASGARPLNDDRRNELRRAVNLPVLASPVERLLADANLVAADATIYQIGPAPAQQVILASAVEPVTLRLNGDLHILPADPPQNADATGVARPRKRAARKSIELHPETWARLNAARQARGQTWEEYIASVAC